MARTIEPGQAWTSATSSMRLLLDVTEELYDLVRDVSLTGLGRTEIDDLDKLISTTRDLVDVAENLTRKERERYGWQ